MIAVQPVKTKVFPMTRYPEYSREKDEISVNLDGLFVSDIAKEYVTPDSTWIDF